MSLEVIEFFRSHQTAGKKWTILNLFASFNQVQYWHKGLKDSICDKELRENIRD